MWRFLVTCGLVLCLVLAPAAHAQVVEDGVFQFAGPLGAVQQHPLRQVLIDPPTSGPLNAPSVRVERGTANVWNSDTWLINRQGQVTHHIADLELETVTADVWVPLGRFLAVGSRLGVARIWGGAPIDGLIENFHNQFDFYRFDRDQAPIGRTRLTVEGPDGPPVNISTPTALFNSPQVHLAGRILEGRFTSLVVNAHAQIPVGDLARALHMVGPEVGASVVLWQRFRGLLSIHLAGMVLWHGNPRLGGLTLNPLQWLGELSLEFRLAPWVTFVLEDRMQTPLMDRTGVTAMNERMLTARATAQNAYFAPVNIISFGPRLYLPTGTSLSIYAGEDFMLCLACYKTRLSRENNAPDISLGLTMRQGFPRL